MDEQIKTTSPAVLAGARALALKRHPHAPMPELADMDDSLVVMNAVGTWVKEMRGE